MLIERGTNIIHNIRQIRVRLADDRSWKIYVMIGVQHSTGILIEHGIFIFIFYASVANTRDIFSCI